MNDLATGARTTHSSDEPQAADRGISLPAPSMSDSERVRVHLARSLLNSLYMASMYDPAIDTSSAGMAEIAHRLIGQRRFAQACSILKCLSTASMYDRDIDASSAGVCEVACRLIGLIEGVDTSPSSSKDSRPGAAT